ncbi:protein DD3-3 isoform X2 [Nematostella vectensis]|uniref:protein DD3-3 isoform X2 n=1 Tax=Nematostella vectensis TaxID=45351 RepID=UPI00138FF5BC|nr:protein DD3-3 isoform X2 [Nematostella vectensis]
MWRSPLLILVAVSSVFSDINLHNPRGGNNRLDEPNRDRRNANRLFDSQNNNRGGHNVGGLYYYGGSILPIQWANQHTCMDRNNNCELVIQYMCDKLVRDGTTITTIPDDPANCYKFDCNKDLRYGMHEDFDYYSQCKKRERNKGLFTIDQPLRGNTARFTRQDRQGTRYGYECPEERDYYPYWHPTQWRDIAILTNDPKRCLMYKEESENVRGRWYCKVEGDVGDSIIPNNKEACEAFLYPADDDSDSAIKGKWTFQASHGLPAPDCRENQWSRDNHQGNTYGGEFMTYNWTVPDIDEENCVLRIRYNISTGEYDGWDPDVNSKLNGRDKINIGAAYGLDRTNASKRGYLFHNDPDVRIFPTVTNFILRIQTNTDQQGRTFQDRSHKFSIRKRPASIPVNKRIFNVNVRGKRGNIVQVYPSVEYDFVPNTLTMAEGEYVHFQWTGSNTNDRNNAGQGLAGTDRSNLLLLADSVYREGRGQQPGTHGHWGRNYPANVSEAKFLGLSREDLVNLALNRPNQLHGELSELDDAGTYYDMGPRQVTQSGTYQYMCTRNNAFTNRSQKGRILVGRHAKYGEIFGWNGGKIDTGEFSVRISPGFFNTLTYVEVDKYSTSDFESYLSSIKRAAQTPPGSGYASEYFRLSPEGEMGCDQASVTIVMGLSKNVGVKVYYSTADTNYATWSVVPAEISITHAVIKTRHESSEF